MIKLLSFKKLIIWSILATSLVCSIWLLFILMRETGLQFSGWYLLLLGLTILPGILVIRLRKIVSLNRIYEFQRTITWLIGCILVISFFYFLEPFARFRIEISHKSWLIGLPVVSLYALLALYWITNLWTKRVQTTQNSQQKGTSSRETFIDFARGFAILLAVGSHAFYAFGYDVLFGDDMYFVMSITRLATPSFVLITGMMFEFVYLRKAEKQGFQATVQSLVMRALQCYGAYLVTVLIEWFNQQLSTTEAIHASLFIGNSLFSGILKFYALFLLLAIPIIWLRKRFGILVISVIPVLVWLLDFLLKMVRWPSTDAPIAHFTALIFGSPALSNFSVWHALTFMSFGMLVAYTFKRSKQVRNWYAFQISLLILFGLCAVVSLFAVLPISGEDFFFNFSNKYRINHQIPYYSIGSMGAFLLLWITWKLRRFLSHPWLENTITTLGKNSLWAFAVGNSLAAVLPALSNQTWFVVMFVLAVLGGSIVIIHVKNLMDSMSESVIIH